MPRQGHFLPDGIMFIPEGEQTYVVGYCCILDEVPFLF